MPIGVKFSHKSASDIFGRSHPNYNDLLNVIIKTEKGKYVPCTAEQVASLSDLAEVDALIEASIKEKKEIEMKVHYRNNTCWMNSVSAYGNTIDTRFDAR